MTQVRDAFRRATSSSIVRGFVFARGIPLLAVLAGFGASWPLVGAEIALVVGVAVGAFARFVTLAWQASKYRFIEFAERDPGASEVVVEAFAIEDADGDPIYVARVDGHDLAHRDPDVLAEVVIDQVQERFDSGEITPTFANYYYTEATEYGHVDIDFVGDEYRADIRTRIEATLREKDGELDVKRLDKQMGNEYADSAYRLALKSLEERGELDVRRGKYVLH